MTACRTGSIASDFRSGLTIGMSATLLVVHGLLLALSAADHGYFTLMMFGGNLIVSLVIRSPFAVVLVHEALLFGIAAYGGC